MEFNVFSYDMFKVSRRLNRRACICLVMAGLWKALIINTFSLLLVPEPHRQNSVVHLLRASQSLTEIL